MLPVGFEPTISAAERPQTYVLDRAATGTVIEYCYGYKMRDDELAGPPACMRKNGKRSCVRNSEIEMCTKETDQ